MVSAYVILIINGKKKFSQIPDNLKPAVKEELRAMGFDENGKPL